MLLHERFEEICKFRVLKPAEVARRAGLHQSILTRLKGLSKPESNTLDKLASTLEVSLDYLCGKEDSDESIRDAIAAQTLRLFSRNQKLARNERSELESLIGLPFAPVTIKGWSDLVQTLHYLRGRVGGRIEHDR